MGRGSSRWTSSTAAAKHLDQEITLAFPELNQSLLLHNVCSLLSRGLVPSVCRKIPQTGYPCSSLHSLCQAFQKLHRNLPCMEGQSRRCNTLLLMLLEPLEAWKVKANVAIHSCSYSWNPSGMEGQSKNLQFAPVHALGNLDKAVLTL